MCIRDSLKRPENRPFCYKSKRQVNFGRSMVRMRSSVRFRLKAPTEKGSLERGALFLLELLPVSGCCLPAMDALCRNGSKVRKRERQVVQEARAVRHGAYVVREYRKGEKRRSRTQAIPLPDASMVRLRSSSIPIKGST